MEINSEEVSCCVEKGQGHLSVELPAGYSSTEIPEAQGHSSVEIPEAQVHSSHSSIKIPEEQGHSSVKIPEDHSRVLVAMEEEVSSCVEKGQGHSSVEIPEGYSSIEIPEAQSHLGVEILEAQGNSSHLSVNIPEEQGHSSVEIPEDLSRLLVAMELVRCCVEKGQGHWSVEIPEGNLSTEIPEAQVHSSHSSVDIPEDHSIVLAAMDEKISKINRVLSDEPLGNIKALISLNCDSVKELHVGPHSPGAREPMEQLKIQCLAYVIQLSRTNLKEYWQRMLPYKGQIRESYEGSDCLHCKYGTRDYSDEELIGMMILDGCFILEFFRFQFFMSIQYKTTIKDHPIAQVERRKLPIIFRDLLQLGNQIPFRVLEQIFQICYPLFQDENDNTLTTEKRLLNIIGAVSLDALGVGRDYVRRFLSDPERFESKFGFGGLKPLHLLDLIRLCLISPHFVKQEPSRDLRQWDITLHGENIPNISKLRISGIKVLQKQDHYLEAAFQAGAIKMPRIILNELMCSFLENCLEFEHQCTSASKYKYISSYVLLLDNLVETADDIDYLRQRRVLLHREKTDEEAANFINTLGRAINFDRIDPSFFKLCSDVNKYYLSERHMKWASFKREYFDKPWLLISVFAGLVLLILSFVQTYYTMRPYLYPQN